MANSKRFKLRRDENIIPQDGGGFLVEYLAWPNDPECSEWIKGEVHATLAGAQATIRASRYNDGEV